MTTPFWCLLAAFLAIWLARIPVFVAIARSEQSFDNREPARQLASLEGFGARAVAAHRGLTDGFAPFAAAVLVAHLAGADPRRSAVLAVAFVVAQIVYVLAYLANVDYLRSLVWLVGFFTVLGLFGLAAGAG